MLKQKNIVYEQELNLLKIPSIESSAKLNRSNNNNSCNKNNFEIGIFTLIFNDFKNAKQKYSINTRFNKSRSVLIKRKDYFLKKENKNNLYFRKIYSNELIKFENEITKIPHYVKKYKEDEISFTKAKLLPEIKWQEFDNDVLTSDEQKQRAIKKELKALGETIKRIQNNDKFFKYNVTMYKLSQKYPYKI